MPVPVFQRRPRIRMIACKIIQTLAGDDMHTQ
jgi:hypothetical protein